MPREEAISSFQTDRLAKRSMQPQTTRLLSAVAAVAAVLLIVLAWTLLIPALRIRPGGTRTGSSPIQSQVTHQAATPPSVARRICSYDDVNLNAAGRIVDYSLDWSKTGKIVFTHWGSGIMSGNNCQRDSHYQDTLIYPRNPVWSPDGTTFLIYDVKIDGNLTTARLQIVNGSGQVQKTVILKTGGPEGIAPSGGGWLSNRINLSANKSDSWGPAWSPDGSTFSAVYFHDNSFHLMTWQTQDEKLVLDAPLGLGLTDTAISYVSWSPSRTIVAIGTNDPSVGVLLINAQTGAVIKHIATQSGWITNLAWSPDGQELATSNRDDKVQIWGVSTGKLIKTLVGATGTAAIDNDLQVAWSPDGTKIAAGDTEPVIWDVSSGKVIATIKSAHPLVVNITWSPDSQRLVTVSTTQDSGTQTKATLEIWRL